MVIQGRLFSIFYMAQNQDHIFADLFRIIQQYLVFNVTTQVSVSDAFYELYDKSERTPLLYKVYCDHLGKSSYRIVVEIRNSSTKELLVQSFTQSVTVDRVTRKSSPLPNWFRDKYRSHCTGSRLVLPVVTNSNTHEVASYVGDVTLPFTDSDWYSHINVTSYIKYVIETAMEASDKGVFKGLFRGSLKMNYRAKTVFMEYLSEIRPGCTLTVSAWKMKEGVDKQKVHFDLTFQGKLICRAYVEFDEVEEVASKL
jgi:acyl-CoA thioesterase FadM